MAGERRYTRIPPESTGDRVWMVHTATIGFEGQTDNNYQWKIGHHYHISGNGGPTMMVHLHGVEDNGTTGHIEVHFTKLDKFNNVEPIVGQNITDPDGVTVIATTTAIPGAGGKPYYDLYIPGQNIIGYDNPEYGMDVDITGSANVRFAEGLPQLDAWGKLRTSGAVQLGDYVFAQEAVLNDNFSPIELAGGYVDFSNTRHAVKVGVDYTVNPTDGFASSSTNAYHHYIAGSSHLYAGTARLNSPATAGAIRRWGYFDANNGFFFMVGSGGSDATDATGFSVVVRSNIPEALQKDTVIPRSDWNGDKLDGTGDSQVTLDLSKVNLWWIDVQWHGAGRVRFGVYEKGQRVVCHSYYQGNIQEQAMSQTASLPCCFAVKSTASLTTDLYIESWSAAVWSESTVDLRAYGAPATYASPHTTVDDTDWVYLFSLSPRELHSNGEVNHTLYTPTSISAYTFDSATGEEKTMDLKMEINAIHDEHSFTSIPGTNVDISTAGTSYQGGKTILQDMFRGKYQNVLTDTFNNFQYGAVKNFADDGGTVENTIVSIDTATPAVMSVSSRLMPRAPMTPTFPLNPDGYEITGTTNSNYDNKQVWVKPTGLTTAELYEDSGLTTPVNGTTLGAATGGNIKGFQGSRVIWSFYAKKIMADSANTDIKTMVIMNWKEIVQ